ncbi:MAG TPA: hypothetical protein DCK78_22550 [Paenibacillus lactis]|jgi:hypothetical protein|nr:hypothetical protein [Paenibacillus lactis]
MKMRGLRTFHIAGAVSGIGSMLLWCILIFFNPYTDTVNADAARNTFLMLFLPGVIALISLFGPWKPLMLIAFLWSVLPSLYLAGTPGIFALFGVTSAGYLIAYLLMKRNGKG